MNPRIEALLSTYPRTRPTLPDTYRHIYEREYKLQRKGARVIESLAKRIEARLHRRAATQSGPPVLEIGAGTLNYLRFESDLNAYDAVEPFTAIHKNNPRIEALHDLLIFRLIGAMRGLFPIRDRDGSSRRFQSRLDL